MGNLVSVCKFCDSANLVSEETNSFYCSKCKTKNNVQDSSENNPGDSTNSSIMKKNMSTCCGVGNMSKVLFDSKNLETGLVETNHISLARRASNYNKEIEIIRSPTATNVIIAYNKNNSINGSTEVSLVPSFIDSEFPPLKKSLFMNGNRVKRVNLIHSNGFKQIRKWLRPSEIIALLEESHLPVSLFSDPSPKDVIQGKLNQKLVLTFLMIFKVLSSLCALKNGSVSVGC
jgi:hypothetical protein